ncbi:MAG: sugar phosphate nucleotidyltransferase [candidate division WOR-3 bacterium]
MKGVVLAGGLGTRLYPLTKITNKHLLPVYNRPMVLYPLMKMAEAGIKDVLLVTGGQHAGDFLRLLGSGKELGLRLAYTYQEGERGIADALSLAEDFSDGEPLLVILGDNIFQDPLTPFIEKYPGRGAMILLAEVPDPGRFGVPVIEDGIIKRIIEKPEVPPSRFAVT